MKALICALAAACTLFAADVEKPRVSRAALAGIERGFDQRFTRGIITDSFDLLGTTRGVYLENYGAVFSAELNLASVLITPMNPRLSPAEIDALHARKVERMPKLRDTMRDMLTNAATRLETLPPNEQIVFAISLFYLSAEKRQGLPEQVVMQATRQQLLDIVAKKAALEAIRVGEY